VASGLDEATSSAAAAATATNYVFLEEYFRRLAEIRQETASIENSVSVQLVFSCRYLRNVTHGEITTVR